MNRKLQKSLLVATAMILCMACDDGGLTELPLTPEEEAEFALSAGTSTNFLSTSYAYDSEAEWVTGALARRFIRGDKLYDDGRTSSNSYGGGLGPVYAGLCYPKEWRFLSRLWQSPSRPGYLWRSA